MPMIATSAPSAARSPHRGPSRKLGRPIGSGSILAVMVPPLLTLRSQQHGRTVLVQSHLQVAQAAGVGGRQVLWAGRTGGDQVHPRQQGYVVARSSGRGPA